MKKTKSKKRAIRIRLMNKKALRFFVKWAFPSLLILLGIVVFVAIKVYWNLSFRWDSLELGILLVILLITIILIPTEKNPKKKQD